MTTPKLLHRAAPALLAVGLAATMFGTALPAAGAITSRSENAANPRGWSAVAGMDTRAVIEMAQSLPPSQEAVGDQPWCGSNAEVAATLSHDFGERKVATGARNTALWGSPLMGTWTMVLERSDAISCVVASGVGYSEGASPRLFFTQAGLGG